MKIIRNTLEGGYVLSPDLHSQAIPGSFVLEACNVNGGSSCIVLSQADLRVLAADLTWMSDTPLPASK